MSIWIETEMHTNETLNQKGNGKRQRQSKQKKQAEGLPCTALHFEPSVGYSYSIPLWRISRGEPNAGMKATRSNVHSPRVSKFLQKLLVGFSGHFQVAVVHLLPIVARQSVRNRCDVLDLVLVSQLYSQSQLFGATDISSIEGHRFQTSKL